LTKNYAQYIISFRGGDVRKTAIFLMVIMAVFILGEFNDAMSAIITVTNTTDNAAGSLRQAISTANPGDIINIIVTGTIMLTTGELVIDKNLTINGPGALNLTISGNNASRVFNINPGVTLDLSNVTVANGHSSDGSDGDPGQPGGKGGAILNDGTLTVTNVTFSSNETGNGGNGGTDGGGGGYGGAIFNNGTLTVTNSTFSGNATGAGGDGSSYGGSGGYGGAIFNQDTLTVTNSTFSDNATGAGGNGSSVGGNGGYGGAIFNQDTLTVTNSTFSGNATGNGGSNDGNDGFGGAIFNQDTLTVTNSTFSGNGAGDGGGIYNIVGTASLRNTIVANSTSGGNCGGSTTITDLGHNLEYNPDNTCDFSGAFNDITGIDPMLGPLQNNGGPTETLALLAGSPAIDAGDNAGVPATDQRGYIRIINGIVDIGAYEYGSSPPVSIPTLTEWGMIIFMLLAGLGAVYCLRRQMRANS
jgi:hypothetical protein